MAMASPANALCGAKPSMLLARRVTLGLTSATTMITYLKQGWYTAEAQSRLRDEVVDGAIDTACMFFRAAVPPAAVSSLALKVRTLATLASPAHRPPDGQGLTDEVRHAIGQRMRMYTDRFPVLQSFVFDCSAYLLTPQDLRALYLHLMHVSQMMQIMVVAKLSRAASTLGFEPHAPHETSYIAGTTSTSLSPSAKQVIAQATLGSQRRPKVAAGNKKKATKRRGKAPGVRKVSKSKGAAKGSAVVKTESRKQSPRGATTKVSKAARPKKADSKVTARKSAQSKGKQPHARR